ncbi:MAG: GNAT family N-acetyltransferase [Candidatus Nealsonbacteria bacterium]|nr:GNAT family N-acetyltransferase [Candidatus Nealsonbacteria bacterium]
MRNWKEKTIAISSERLSLVPIEGGDGREILEWINNGEIVSNFQFFTGAFSIEEESRYLTKMADSPTDFLLGLFINNGRFIELIGTCGLHEIDFKNDTARLGIIIGKKEHWNEGYAREAIRALLGFAFNAMNLHKIYLNVFVTNGKAVHLYAQVGFRIEGTLRSEYKIRGGYVDMYRMAILREEWKKSV